MDLVDISDAGAQTKAYVHLCKYLFEFYKEIKAELSVVFFFFPTETIHIWFQIFIAHPQNHVVSLYIS